MSDQFKIDSHKLQYHPERVAAWRQALGTWPLEQDVYPIYVEISPTAYCNHNCSFCGLDFAHTKDRIEVDALETTIEEFGRLGVKSVMFAGEGEPLLYREMPEILKLCKHHEIDTSLTTNLVPMTTDSAEAILENCKWIKVSINGGNKETYTQIHGAKPDDFERVLMNMKTLSGCRGMYDNRCTLGAQMVLLPENTGSALELAAAVRDAGFDYLVIKPYSQHLSSNVKREISYSDLGLATLLKQQESDMFKVIYRGHTIDKLSAEVPYKQCWATPFFWAYIDSKGNVWGCSCFLGKDERFCYGNIHKQSFEQIWHGDRRRENIEYLANVHDIKDCRQNCRMDECNRYLHEIQNPNAHVNFI